MLLSLLLFTGCDRHPPVTAKPPAVELRYAYWSLEAREITLTREVITQFEASKPGVRIRVDGIPDRYYEKLMTQFAAGDPPDVFAVNLSRLSDFVRRDLVLDLAPVLDQDAAFRRDAFGAALGAFRGVGTTLGKPGLYALPRDWNPTNLLAYSRDAFDAAELAYPTDQWTWEDFAGACRRLTVRGADGRVERHGGSLCLYPYALSAWLYQNGGDILSADGRECVLASEKNVEALRFLQGLVEDGVVAPATPARDDSLDEFLSGRVAMAFVTPYVLGRLREQKEIRWGLAPPLVGKRQQTGCIATGIAISRRCGAPREAYDLARFLVTEGAARAAREGLCAPAWGPGLESLTESEEAHVIRCGMAMARPIPASPAIPYEQLLDLVRNATERVFVLGEEPGKALKQAQAQIEEAMGQ
jgi:multiple sugar transport system substrate-binding protein